MDFEENAAEAPAMENANAAAETAAESAIADEIKAVPMDNPAEKESRWKAVNGLLRM